MKFHMTLAITAMALLLPAAATQPTPASPAVALYWAGPQSAKASSTPAQLRQLRILSLRREALALRDQDGGTLSPEHYAMLQAKLDRINAEKD